MAMVLARWYPEGLSFGGAAFGGAVCRSGSAIKARVSTQSEMSNRIERNICHPSIDHNPLLCKFYSFKDKQELNSSTPGHDMGEEWLRFLKTQYHSAMRVLLVEDDTRIARFVAKGLRE